MDKLVGFARKKRLGDLLVDAGVISQDQLVKALQVQKTEKQGERLGVVLIDLGFTDEKQIVEKSQSFVRGNERSAGYPGDGRCFHHYRVSGGAFCCNPE